MREEAIRCGSTLGAADPTQITDEDITGFQDAAFKENVAIGPAVALLLGISRAVAMTGTQRAAPDPGSLQLKHVRIGDKRVIRANLFAINDRENTVLAVKRPAPYRTPDTTTMGLLINRTDREHQQRLAALSDCL